MNVTVRRRFNLASTSESDADEWLMPTERVYLASTDASTAVATCRVYGVSRSDQGSRSDKGYAMPIAEAGRAEEFLRRGLIGLEAQVHQKIIGLEALPDRV